METIKCSQCERPAIGFVSGLPLCVNCYYKLQQANWMQEATYANYMNFLIGQMEATVGLYGVTPRYEIPLPIIHQGSMNIQNIKVDKSNVGVINTGEIQRIEIARSFINKSGNNELTEAIREFTEAVIDEKSLNKDIKNQLIEMISFLSTQAALPKQNRKPNIAKTVLKSIKDTLAGLASLASLMASWDKIAALFEKLFNG